MSKKRSIIAVTIILIAALLFPSFSIVAQPSRIYHEDPATARDDFDLVSILVFYTNVFDLTAGRHYTDASAMLNELRHANIPAHLRYLLDRYNTLSHQLFARLNKAEALLFEASALVSEDRIDDARQKLNEAEMEIRSAQFLLVDVETATNSLGGRLGVFAASASSDLRSTFARLLAVSEQLKTLIFRTYELVRELVENPRPVITSFSYLTSLEVAAPSIAYPGIPVTISGQVSSTGLPIDRTLTVSLDHIQLAEVITPGLFGVQITPPPETATGVHTLTVVATPWQHYTAASWSAPINILQMPITIDVRVPAIIIIPQPFTVTGKISQLLEPVADARVTLTLTRSSTTVETAADGSFAARINTPFDLSVFGPQKLTVAVTPAEPWYATATADKWIFTLNSANIGLLLIAFISLGMLVMRRVKTRPSRLHRETFRQWAKPAESFTVTPAPGPRYEYPPGAKGKVLAAYHTSLMAISQVAGMTMAPPATLREFATVVMPLIPSVFSPFEELTTIAEIALYSPRQADEEMLARAELLADIIIKELHGTA